MAVIVIFILSFILCFNQSILADTKTTTCTGYPNDDSTEAVQDLLKKIVPELLQGNVKGEAGKIGIIGGSIEYTGAPYFAAISSLKVGADLVYVITTESAAPVIKSYSPDLIVYPYLNLKEASKINSLLLKMDVIVIGPGLGRNDEAVKLTEDIIKTCKSLGKPLVIDADGLYVVSKNPDIIKDYPAPGVIMTPNKREAKKLEDAVAGNDSHWFSFWGDNVSVLKKGEKDQFYTSTSGYNWSSSEGGSGRRAAGQGDILSGSLGTLYGWAIKYNNNMNCDRNGIAHSVAAYGSAQITRLCNSKAFKTFGRSMTASDMINEIHEAFEDVF